MFTGLIEAIGTIEERHDTASGARVRVGAAFDGSDPVAEGDSISVSGVCLTAIAPDARGFFADVSPETLRVTTLDALAAGSRVNLERAVRADARLGGHFVLGHVDTTSTITQWASQGEHWWLEIALPDAIKLWVVEKGSIAVDGISLTIARLTSSAVGIQIVPHTREHTTLSDRRSGDRVNLEADIIGKYAARLASLAR